MRNAAHQQPADGFIPLRPADLVRQLGDEPAVTIFEREQFRSLCELIEATVHYDYSKRLKQLQDDYAPLDPDSDVAAQFELSDEERAERARRLFDDFDALLGRANYRRLARDEIEAAVRAPNAAGLRLQVDLAQFERLEVYVRGACQLRGGPGYRRLALIFRLRASSPRTDPLDARSVALKLFKDIPRPDLETLLPGADVRIGPIEQAQIVVPTLSGIGLTLFKLLKGAAALAFVGLYGLLAFLALASGAIGYGVRSFFSYLHLREKHQLRLTRHLYFQNLDNNAGVIYHLLAEAEAQEFREIALAWWLLWRGGLAGGTAAEIDAAAEAWLRERCGVAVDFEVADALAKLLRLGLASQTPRGRWRAVSIEQALARLDQSWDEQFTYPFPRIWRAAA